MASWEIDVEPEVTEWLEGLSEADFHAAAAAIDRLERSGNRLRMPLSRALGGGLFELRFTAGGVARRVTYTFRPGRRIVLLTTFRKQRQKEQAEIRRAREALERLREEEDRD